MEKETSRDSEHDLLLWEGCKGHSLSEETAAEERQKRRTQFAAVQIGESPEKGELWKENEQCWGACSAQEQTGQRAC